LHSYRKDIHVCPGFGQRKQRRQRYKQKQECQSQQKTYTSETKKFYGPKVARRGRLQAPRFFLKIYPSFKPRGLPRERKNINSVVRGEKKARASVQKKPTTTCNNKQKHTDVTRAKTAGGTVVSLIKNEGSTTLKNSKGQNHLFPSFVKRGKAYNTHLRKTRRQKRDAIAAAAWASAATAAWASAAAATAAWA
jgi:hypothetical protein